VAWHTPFPDYTTQRPVAWGGQVNPQTCDDEAVWTAGCGGGFSPGFGGGGNVFVHRLNGTTGAIEDTVEVTGFGCSGFGASGGAVDTDGHFWIAHNGSGGKLGFVDGNTLATEVHDFPAGGFAGYGITVDNKGRPWVSSYGGDLGAGVFDPMTKSWQTVGGFASQGGIQQGEDGRIWVATVSGFGATNDQNGIVWVDDVNVTVGDYIPVQGGTVKGISLDVDGFVWAVTGTAYKIDTVDPYDVDGSYGGLSGPYTYSDMTGWGLQNSVCNPVG
jgi:streptogramin lyase